MPKQQKPATRGSDGFGGLRDDFRELFPDGDRFAEFELEWGQIKKEQAVSPAKVLSIHRWALACSRFEEQTHQALDLFALDFFEQAKQAEKLVERLREVTEQLRRPEWFKAAVLLSLHRAYQKDLPRALAGSMDSRAPSELELMSPPAVLKMHLDVAHKARMEMWWALRNFFGQIGRLLHRNQGQQPQPWKEGVRQDLRNAGLTKAQTEAHLRILGLKPPTKDKTTR